MQPEGLADAAQAAERAAVAAGVELRELVELADLAAVYGLFDRVWRPDPANPPITVDLMRALAHAGNYLVGAYHGETLVGAAVGFLAAPAGIGMHSHVAGVAPGLQGRDVGFALKVHQRAWAMQRGLSTIHWTFDPLVRRNCFFTMAKLRAEPEAYLHDFYGTMGGLLNGADESDRLLVRWDLLSPATAAACHGAAARDDVADLLVAGAVVGLAVGPGGGPERGPTGGEVVLVAVPADVEALRSTAPAVAAQWRRAVRDVLGSLLSDGGRVVGFAREGWFVVRR